MYIAINMKLAKVDLQRAFRFRLQAETVVDLICEMNRRAESFNDYWVFSLEPETDSIWGTTTTVPQGNQ